MRINNILLKSTSLFLLLLSFLPAAQAFEPAASDVEMLTKVERASVLYFVKLSDKKTGLTRDSSRPGSPASIAATGFALAAVAIGQARGWLDPDQSYRQIEKTLHALLNKAEHKNGFFYHFLDMPTGKRVWSSEASSIDTALLVAGALVAAQYYPGTPVEDMALKIYKRVNWAWMMNGSDFVCMGWKPESGFLPYYWDSYNELIILQALALGSPTHPIPVAAWERWMRHIDEYNGHQVVYSGSGSLFTYQFAQAFIDFKSLDDNGINYFKNSTEATLANRDYSLFYRDQHQGYTENSWGLSASVGPGGYKAYGAKPGGGEQDGTIAPYAAVSSIVFTPEESISAIHHFYYDHGKNLFGIFGFKDAFNIDKAWWAEEYLGIDQGISVLMLENYLNDGIIWEKFMRLDAIKRWVKLCDLQKEPLSMEEKSYKETGGAKELLGPGNTNG